MVSKKSKYGLAQGFTIVELLIVIVVIAVLAAISIIAFNGVQSRAIDSAGKSDIKTVNTKLKIFEIDNSRYPVSDTELSASIAQPTSRVYNTSKTYNLVYCINTDPPYSGNYVYGALLQSGTFVYTTSKNTGSISNPVFTSPDDICNLGNVPTSSARYIYCGKSADVTATWPIARPGTYCGF